MSNNTTNESDNDSSSSESDDEMINDKQGGSNSDHSVEYEDHRNTNTKRIETIDVSEESSGIGNGGERDVVVVAENNDAGENDAVASVNNQLENQGNWKLRAIVHFKHPKKTFTNATGVGEVTTWDLVDDTGSMNLVAFNIQSNMMTNTLIIGKCYEMSHLSIKTVDRVYKTLSNDVQLLATSRTSAHEVVSNFTYEPVANFVTLQEIENLPLHSIVVKKSFAAFFLCSLMNRTQSDSSIFTWSMFYLDVNVQVLRDYGTTTGFSNNYSWSRREIHVGQNGVAIRMTLWNDQVR
ncbi:unnamed protein product [Adineta ricciae]|uniref:Uncharacterized protein n=1 Tax=Adineta ricciae TaxID=249248 RepID=A0A815R7I7_ADIRI|nr:unnamed protein product [Adineta ricciae]